MIQREKILNKAHLVILESLMTHVTTQVHLVGLHLTRIPSTIFDGVKTKWKDIETLNISENPIKFLPSCMKQMEALKILNTTGTKIHSIPDFLKNVEISVSKKK